MSLLNRLRPKWQNSDPDVRVDAVRQLDKNEIELLTAVAQHDTDARVRKVAIKKLDAPRLLLELAETDTDEGVRVSAQTRARHLLVKIACDSRDADESARALELLAEASDIASVADKAHFEEVRTSAFDALGDDDALVALVQTANNPELRGRALERIQAPSALKNIVLDANAGDRAMMALNRIEDVETLEAIAEHGGVTKSIRRQALAKLTKLVPDDHPIKIQQREQLYSALCERADQLETDAAGRDEVGELESIASAWSELASHGSPSNELAERYQAVTDRIRERAAKKTARAQDSAEEPAPPPEAETSSEPVSVHSALIDRVATLGDDGLADALALARAEWEALEERTEALEARFEKVFQKAEGRLQTLETLGARKLELRALLDEAETASKGDDAEAKAAAIAKLSKKWRTLESVADADAKARYAHLEERAHELIETKRREQEAEEQKTLTEVQTCLAKLNELTNATELSIRDADKALRAAQNLLKTMGPLARSVNRKKIRRELSDARENLFKKTQDTRAIEDWKRWANADIQNGLIARIEKLREVRDTPKVAKELRAIHEEWKKAGAAPSEKAEELWNRYKTIRDELKARCDVFFEQQNKDRTENLKQKEALCVEVEALADSVDWNKTADLIKAFQEKWKAIGPAPQKQSDAVWKRFRKACDQFFARRKGHFDELKGERNENLKKKEALCEKAESIQESTDWRTTADELKRLQAEWRTIGTIPRKKSDQVWKRFRKACDYFFDRYNRRGEVELEERFKQREALLEDATRFADAMPDDASEVAAKTKELWAEWKKLGTVPESKREVQQRFDAIVTRLVSGAPDAFADTDLDPAASRKRRERLVSRLENLVNDFTAKTAPEADPLEDLAQRLKDALASNTMTGGKARDKKLDWRSASEEVKKLRANWIRTPPVPGDEGRALVERFDAAYKNFQERKPQ